MVIRLSVEVFKAFYGFGFERLRDMRFSRFGFEMLRNMRMRGSGFASLGVGGGKQEWCFLVGENSPSRHKP